MWKQISSFIRRHRRKFFVVGGVIGGFVILNSYLRKKFLEYEAKQRTEYIESLKRQKHFEGTLEVCDQKLLSFAPKISETVSTNMDVTPIVDALKTKPSNKIELWEELKVLVFTQAVGEIYAQSLLVVLLRVQLSILGGYMYADFHKNKLAAEEPDELAVKANHMQYFSHISSFFESGIKDLLKPIETAIRAILKNVQLKESMMLKDISALLDKIKLEVAQGGPQVVPSILQYIMPTDCNDLNQNEDSAYGNFLVKMTNETKDIIECQDFNQVLLSCIDHGFAILMDRFSECFVHVGNSYKTFVNPNNAAVPLAKIIPLLHTLMTQHKPKEQGSLVQVLLTEETLKSFSANIYESFSQCGENLKW